MPGLKWGVVKADWLLGVILTGAFVSVLIYSNRPKREDMSKNWVTIQYGPVETRDSNPTYLLGLADTPEEVEMLIRSGTDPNHLDKSHPTFWTRPLHSALRSPGIIKVLLRGGADPNGRDTTLDHQTGRPERHRTPLQALLTQFLPNAPIGEVAGKLIAGGAQVNVTDGDGNTLLHLAVRNGSADMQQVSAVVDALLAASLSAGTRNRAGQTPLELIRKRRGEHQARRKALEGSPLNTTPFDVTTWERDDRYLREIEGTLLYTTNSV